MGNVISAEIVPNGCHEYVTKSINFILNNQPITCLTQCLYTDKAESDKNLQNVFKNYYKNTFNVEMDTIILQDIYHMKDRIVRTLPKSHADYHIATKQLTSIFSTLKIKDDKLTKKDFCKILDKWESDFSSCQIGKTSLENVALLGKILSDRKSDNEQNGKPIITSETVHALHNLKQEPQISSVWNITLYSHLQQGKCQYFIMYFITLH